jgi:hypothetical protein
LQLKTEGRGREEKDEQGGVSVDLRVRENIVAGGAPPGLIRPPVVCAPVRYVSPNTPNTQLARSSAMAHFQALRSPAVNDRLKLNK